MEDYTEVYAVISILGARSDENDTTTSVFIYLSEEAAEQQAEEVKSTNTALDPNDENIVQTTTFHVPADVDVDALDATSIVAYDDVHTWERDL